MKIEEKDFILESENEKGNFFDLSLLTTVNKGKSNERSEMKIVAYGIQLPVALKYIAHYRASNNLGEVATLKEYLTEYKEAVRRLEQLVK